MLSTGSVAALRVVDIPYACHGLERRTLLLQMLPINADVALH